MSRRKPKPSSRTSSDKPRRVTPSPRLTLGVALVALAWWVVYTGHISLNYRTIDGASFRELSRAAHEESLQGARPLPYQWRALGSWAVALGERLAGLDPHLVDAALKTTMLAASSYFLFLFATTVVDVMGALLVVALYLLLTVAAFASQGPAIYFLNDYILMAGWCGAVAAARVQRWALAALAAFAAAWSRETAVLIVLLVIFESWQRRAPWWAAAAATAAVAIPTVALRTMYPAPLEQWAWWHVAAMNVPFLEWSRPALALVVRNNLKVIIFLNVLWALAFLHWKRAADPFIRSLGLALAGYAVMAWMVVYLRELRHMLPFTVLVLPLAVAEVERLVRAARSPAGRIGSQG